MRTFAAIYLSTANDLDFRSLHYREQHMYWTLLRQQKLNRAGLLDLNVHRWAQSADGMSETQVIESLVILAERRYVVIDPQSRELLIRTYVRNDGAYKNPKMMVAVVSCAHEIESPRLRRALLAEMDRIPLDELSDEPGKTGAPSVRARILDYITQLRKILEGPSPNDPSGLDTPDGTPTVAQLRLVAGLSDTHSDTRTDARGDGYQIAPGTRARAHGVPSPEPEPEPKPKTLAPLASVTVLPVAVSAEEAAAPQREDGALFAAPPQPEGAKGGSGGKGAARTPRTRKQRTPEEQERFEIADALTRAWYEALPRKPSGEEQKVFLAVRPIVEGFLKADNTPDDVAEALSRCSRAVTKNAMEYQLVAMEREAARVVVPMQRSTPPTYQNPTTNAGYVGGWRRPSA